VGVAEEPPWTTATDLAEYVYCPRALYYRRHGEPPPSRAAAAGAHYHRRQLQAERWRDEHPGLPWVVVAAGVALLFLALAVVIG